MEITPNMYKLYFVFGIIIPIILIIIFFTLYKNYYYGIIICVYGVIAAGIGLYLVMEKTYYLIREFYNGNMEINI